MAWLQKRVALGVTGLALLAVVTAALSGFWFRFRTPNQAYLTYLPSTTVWFLHDPHYDSRFIKQAKQIKLLNHLDGWLQNTDVLKALIDNPAYQDGPFGQRVLAAIPNTQTEASAIDQAPWRWVLGLQLKRGTAQAWLDKQSLTQSVSSSLLVPEAVSAEAAERWLWISPQRMSRTSSLHSLADAGWFVPLNKTVRQKTPTLVVNHSRLLKALRQHGDADSLLRQIEPWLQHIPLQATSATVSVSLTGNILVDAFTPTHWLLNSSPEQREAWQFALKESLSNESDSFALPLVTEQTVLQLAKPQALWLYFKRYALTPQQQSRLETAEALSQLVGWSGLGPAEALLGESLIFAQSGEDWKDSLLWFEPQSASTQTVQQLFKALQRVSFRQLKLSQETSEVGDLWQLRPRGFFSLRGSSIPSVSFLNSSDSLLLGNHRTVLSARECLSDKTSDCWPLKQLLSEQSQKDWLRFRWQSAKRRVLGHAVVTPKGLETHLRIERLKKKS